MCKDTIGGTTDANRETLIFLHVPKTAGVSMSKAIVRHFSEDEIYHVRYPEHKLGPVFSKHHGTLQHFLHFPEAQRGRYRLLLGHMHFGLHKYLPGPSAYVTVLRDPVERLLSHFGQFRRTVENNELPGAVPVSSLQEFCRAEWKVADNHQTRHLCGWNFDDHSRRENLERAKENLREHFRVVGTMERFDQTVQVLHRACGWPDLVHFRLNVGEGRLQREGVDSQFLAHLEALNSLDRELHALANSLLDTAIDKYGKVRVPTAPLRQAPRRPFFLRRAWHKVLRRCSTD
ncbi:MAG TPA: sulfotransferase family 2 domain-containing protein [Thermoguttaceae bacterium]|nr:sulfotransferase family 2 domain-containing protein [Thermoguttaceae bacterium]